MLPFTLLEILGVGAEWESRFILPGGGWEMLPMAKDGINRGADVIPSLAATSWPHSAWLRTTTNRN